MVEEKEEDLSETLVSVLAWQFAISKQQTMLCIPFQLMLLSLPQDNYLIGSGHGASRVQ